jgi:hypothetical protein
MPDDAHLGEQPPFELKDKFEEEGLSLERRR